MRVYWIEWKMVLTPPVTRCRVSSVCVPVVSSVWSWVSVCGVLTTVRSRGSWVSRSRVGLRGRANVTPNRTVTHAGNYYITVNRPVRALSRLC